jgi:RNA polymerase sigma-70 factor (ECF subfamily)
LNIIRRRKIEKSHNEMSNIERAPNFALRHNLMKTIGQLDDSSQEILILRYYQDMKYEEIAEFLNISLSSVKIRIFRAKKALKAKLGDNGDEVR